MLGQVHDADIKLLRVFSVIARTGGFTAAQAELNTSQAFISTQMKNLEERLGTRLCQRGHGGFKLTESGEAVLRATEKLFAAMDEFRSEAEAAVDPMLGQVRFGVVDQIATSEDCAVGPAIGEFSRYAPNASIALHIVPPLDLETMLLDGRLDMAYGIFHHYLPSLRYESLGSEGHEVYCCREHDLFAVLDEDITDDVLKDQDYVGWDYLESGDLLDQPLSSKLRAASPYIEAVLHYVLSGRYIGYLPAHVARSWVERGRLRSLCSQRLRRCVNIQLATRNGTELSSVANAFRDTLLRAHGLELGPAS